MNLNKKILFLSVVFVVLNVSSAIKCKICDKSNEKCASSPGSLSNEDCANGVSECFSSVDKTGALTRGCVESGTQCENDSCRKCGSDGCNIETFFCKYCDSSKDANCATLKDETSIVNKLCDADIKKCSMKTEDKKTIRDCVSKNEESCAEPTCNTCETAACNNGIFPLNRRLCFQCNDQDSKCAKPLENGIKALPCALYDPSDKCYHQGTSETAMNRGCSSDEGFKTCATSKCIECSSDKCNSAEFKITQSLKCVQCPSSDSSCISGYSSSDAKVCEKKIEYWQTEGCYEKKIDTNKIERGCLNDVQCANDDKCKSCTNGDGCNVGSIQSDSDFECYVCRSTDNKNCSKKLDGDSFSAQKCRNPITDGNNGCYTENWNGIIIRSCLVDADKTTIKQCKNPEYKQCKICTEKKCNFEDPPNSAHSVTLATGLIALTLLFLKFF